MKSDSTTVIKNMEFLVKEHAVVDKTAETQDISQLTPFLSCATLKYQSATFSHSPTL